jgi:hypothetical protein
VPVAIERRAYRVSDRILPNARQNSAIPTRNRVLQSAQPVRRFAGLRE